MLPVVPKVRVGDVLYATRNLRNWLQTASLLYSVKQMHDGRGLRGSKSTIYIPHKKDRYIVCVNAGLVFAVFVPERERVLFFINAAGGEKDGPKYAYHPDRRPGSRYAPKSNKNQKKDSDRMSPALFSTWFVRTEEKLPDLRNWPDYAYATWASLQMNAISIAGDYRLVVQIPRRNDYLFIPDPESPGGLGNFGTGKRMKDRSTIRACLQYAIKTGMTRRKHQDGHFHMMLLGHAVGPRMEDLNRFQKDMRGWLKNPRTRKSLEMAETATGKSKALSYLLEGLQKNL